VQEVSVTAARDIADATRADTVTQRLTLLDEIGSLRIGPFAVITFDAPRSAFLHLCAEARPDL
jgi:hypothetical protein